MNNFNSNSCESEKKYRLNPHKLIINCMILMCGFILLYNLFCYIRVVYILNIAQRFIFQLEFEDASAKSTLITKMYIFQKIQLFFFFFQIGRMDSNISRHFLNYKTYF